MHTYMRHLADQQIANHRGQMQLNDNFYYYTPHQHCQDPNPYPWHTPEQFRASTPFWVDQRLVFPQGKKSPTSRGEYLEFIAKITRRNWRQLAEPIPKYDLEVVLEFYANAWPTEKGVLDKYSKVLGQWILMTQMLSTNF